MLMRTAASCLFQQNRNRNRNSGLDWIGLDWIGSDMYKLHDGGPDYASIGNGRMILQNKE
ncbi:hypothetical protein BGAL_0007g00420 [Botrytis galanthina]|uniref:Uncharacterized protein n=1 Tax=Botrytis galanthina TaxID=278940 RepID=A0A4S8RDJ8_9HELO|nr:hypothetical protein BGAL_0007g00420 [Botrytis galanthina]